MVEHLQKQKRKNTFQRNTEKQKTLKSSKINILSAALEGGTN